MSQTGEHYRSPHNYHILLYQEGVVLHLSLVRQYCPHTPPHKLRGVNWIMIETQHMGLYEAHSDTWLLRTNSKCLDAYDIEFSTSLQQRLGGEHLGLTCDQIELFQDPSLSPFDLKS